MFGLLLKDYTLLHSTPNVDVGVISRGKIVGIVIATAAWREAGEEWRAVSLMARLKWTQKSQQRSASLFNHFCKASLLTASIFQHHLQTILGWSGSLYLYTLQQMTQY